jgi:hypothetical protein
VCQVLQGGMPSMGTLPRLAYKHPANPQPGNIMSISAVAIYNDKIFFGDITLATIYSVPMSIAVTPFATTSISAPIITLVANNAGIAGLFTLPVVGLVYVDYNRGAGEGRGAERKIRARLRLRQPPRPTPSPRLPPRPLPRSALGAGGGRADRNAVDDAAAGVCAHDNAQRELVAGGARGVPARLLDDEQLLRP